MDNSYTIGFFISPHGLGHAARSAAVMEEIHRLMPETRFEIFTLVPEWFFKTSLSCPFGYHPILTDIGLVQKTPLIEDMEETINRLDDFLPFKLDRIKRLSKTITRLGCNLIICDISTLGIAVSKEAGIPSILIENFTWDWIYENYESHQKRVEKHICYLRELYGSADYHIQTEPICNHLASDLKTAPVSRRIRTQPEKVKRILNIPEGEKMVMLTISGNSEGYNFLKGLKDFSDTFFIIPNNVSRIQTQDNLIFLPQDSNIFHPDLVNASDVTIGKLGYSTVAEVYYAGVPLGYVTRKTFRESGRLEEFCREEMECNAIGEGEFTNGKWLLIISELLRKPRIVRRQENGAVRIAEFIFGSVFSETI